MTYTPEGHLKTLKLINPVTGDQTTTWIYGTTLTDSGVARSDLLPHARLMWLPMDQLLSKA